MIQLYKLYTMDLPVPKAGKIDKIYHISDLHIKNGNYKQSKLENYKNIFDQFINCIEGDSSVVVITGDIFDIKDTFSGTSLMLCNMIFELLPKKCPVYIIKGNHDYRQEDPTCPDAIFSMLYERNRPNISYLNKTGIYRAANVTFGVFEIEDALKTGYSSAKHSNSIKFPIPDGEIKIALYHGFINGADIRYEHEKVDIDLQGYDYGLFGDIHLRQIHYEKNGFIWAYPGSMVQQNIGESVTGHGYLLWDLVNKCVTAHDIKPLECKVHAKFENNEWYFYNYKNDILVTEFLKQEYCPKKIYIRSSDDTESLKSLLADIDYVISEKMIKTAVETPVTDSKIMHNYISYISEQTKDKILDYQDWMKWFDDHETLLIQSDIDKVDEFNKEIKKEITRLKICNESFLESKNSGKFKINYIKWDYVLCYGAHNYVNFDTLEGIVAICAKNGYGKSAFLEIICIGLFGKQLNSRTVASSTSIMNCFKPPGSTSQIIINFNIGDKTYTIIRTIWESDTWKLNATLYDVQNKEITSSVKDWVTANIGEADAFTSTCFVSQQSDDSFFSSAKQTTILDKSFNFETIKIMQELFKKAKLKYKATYDIYDEIRKTEHRFIKSVDNDEYIGKKSLHDKRLIELTQFIKEYELLEGTPTVDMSYDDIKKIINEISIEYVYEMDKIDDPIKYKIIGHDHKIEPQCDKPELPKPEKKKCPNYKSGEIKLKLNTLIRKEIVTDIKYSAEQYEQFIEKYNKIKDLDISNIPDTHATINQIPNDINYEYLSMAKDDLIVLYEEQKAKYDTYLKNLELNNTIKDKLLILLNGVDHDAAKLIARYESIDIANTKILYEKVIKNIKLQEKISEIILEPAEFAENVSELYEKSYAEVENIKQKAGSIEYLMNIPDVKITNEEFKILELECVELISNKYNTYELNELTRLQIEKSAKLLKTQELNILKNKLIDEFNECYMNRKPNPKIDKKTLEQNIFECKDTDDVQIMYDKIVVENKMAALLNMRRAQIKEIKDMKHPFNENCEACQKQSWKLQLVAYENEIANLGEHTENKELEAELKIKIDKRKKLNDWKEDLNIWNFNMENDTKIAKLKKDIDLVILDNEYVLQLDIDEINKMINKYDKWISYINDREPQRTYELCQLKHKYISIGFENLQKKYDDYLKYIKYESDSKKLIKYREELEIINITEEELLADIEFYNLSNYDSWVQDKKRLDEIEILKSELNSLNLNVVLSPDNIKNAIDHYDYWKYCASEYNKIINKDRIDLKIQYLDLTSKYDTWIALKNNYEFDTLTDELKNVIEYEENEKLIGKWQAYEQYNFNKALELEIKIEKLKKYKDNKQKLEYYNNLLLVVKPASDKKKALKGKIEEYRRVVNNLEFEIRRIEDQLESNTALSKIQDEMYEKMTELKNKEKTIEVICNLLNTYKFYIYDKQIIPELLNTTNKIMKNMCITVPTLLCKVGAKDDKILLDWYMKDDRVIASLKKSGGYHQFVVDLALRIALTTTGSTCIPSKQIFIDEGFVAADSENINLIPEFIQSLTGYFNAIILISHSDIIKECANTQIHIVKKETSTMTFGKEINGQRKHVDAAEIIEIVEIATVAKPVKSTTLKKTAILNKVECGFIQQSNGKPCTNAANNGNRCGKHKDK
jgi:DNA repair exonuclease SbcCD ATPase subunit/DNA repair exonuclease SbcCD nuclease subunit